MANLLDGVRIRFGKKRKEEKRFPFTNSVVLMHLFLIFFLGSYFQYYKQLNIHVKLVGLVIFKDENPFGLDGTAGDVLGRFVKWRKSTLLPRIRHDIGQLIV